MSILNNSVNYSFIGDAMKPKGAASVSTVKPAPSMSLDGVPQRDVQSLPESHTKETGMSGAGQAAIGAGIGLVGSMATSAINSGRDANDVKYGTDSGLTSSIGGAIGTMIGGPIAGAAIGAGIGVIDAVGNKMTDEDAYGQKDNGITGDIGNAIGSITDPIGNIETNMDLVDKGVLTEGEAVLASIPVVGGFFGANDKKEAYAEKRRKEGEKRKKDIEAQKERLASIQGSKQNYNSIMQSANMYGGSYIAKSGGIVNYPHFNKGSIYARKHGFQKSFKKEEGKTLKFKKGGSLNQGVVFSKPILNKSIIMNGALHSEFNNIGKGDKGLPIVMADGGKIYEIERDELLLNKDDSNLLLVSKNKSNIELGKVFSNILLDNTDAKSDDYKCLNNNTCSL